MFQNDFDPNPKQNPIAKEKHPFCGKKQIEKYA
jgi:hypothetical protein